MQQEPHLVNCLHRKIITSFLVCLITIYSVPSFGFESSEHERISDAALQLALSIYRESQPNDEAAYLDGMNLVGEPGKYARDQKIIDDNRIKGDKPLPVSYGDIVACVDYFLYPEEIVADSLKYNRVASDSSGLPIYIKDRPVVDIANSCHGKNSYASIQAAHNNHAHFQQEAMMSFRIYHMAAVAAATPGEHRNVYGALVLNAIADHFLQDFFAPGHIVTSRDALSDVPATAMHDLANEHGFDFLPRNREKLISILNKMCISNASDLNTGKCVFKAPGLRSLLINSNSELPFIQAIKDLISDLPRAIHFRGDNRLWDSSEAQTAQRLYLLLVETRSILDVLEEKNSFMQIRWRSGSILEFTNHPPALFKGQFVGFFPAEASIDFGSYCLRPTDCAPDTKSLNATSSAAIDPAQQKPSIPDVAQPQSTRVARCQTELTDEGSNFCFGTFSPVFGINIQGESISSSPERVSATLEAFPAGLQFPGIGAKVPPLTVAPSFGYTAYSDGTHRGSGPMFGMVVNIPETELTLTPYTRFLRYPNASDSLRHYSYGLRIEEGFTSYLLFTLGIGRDYGFTQQDSIKRGLMWSAGIEFGGPKSRFPSWLGGRKDSNEPTTGQN